MNANKHSEASTGEKLDATDGDVGTYRTFGEFLQACEQDEIDYNDPAFRAADMAAIDDERFEELCSEDPKSVWRAIKRLELDVLRGVRSVRAEIDSDTQNGLAQQAYDRYGDHARKAFKLGREWALSHRPTFAELSRRERRFEERRLREDARLAKQAWERGEPPVFHGDEYIAY